MNPDYLEIGVLLGQFLSLPSQGSGAKEIRSEVASEETAAPRDLGELGARGPRATLSEPEQGICRSVTCMSTSIHPCFLWTPAGVCEIT